MIQYNWTGTAVLCNWKSLECWRKLCPLLLFRVIAPSSRNTMLMFCCWQQRVILSIAAFKIASWWRNIPSYCFRWCEASGVAPDISFVVFYVGEGIPCLRCRDRGRNSTLFVIAGGGWPSGWEVGMGHFNRAANDCIWGG